LIAQYALLNSSFGRGVANGRMEPKLGDRLARYMNQTISKFETQPMLGSRQMTAKWEEKKNVGVCTYYDRIMLKHIVLLGAFLLF
jgi:hypothetical protein